MRNLLLCLAAFAVCATARADLSIDNFQAGDVVRYPLVIVRGAAVGPEMAIGTSWSTAIRFPVVNHRYAAAVELKPGANMLVVHSGAESMKFRLDYKPMTGPYKVSAFYVVASDEHEIYYSPEPLAKYPIRQKFDFAMRLLQGFCADAMDRAGYGHTTFQVELDSSGHVPVHFVKSPKTGAELRALGANDIWSHAYEVIKKDHPEATTKWCALMGFTSFDLAAKKSVGALALGGGSLAAFGSGTMRLWPGSLKELPKVLSDSTVIDGATTLEDSGNRGTVWANISTAYGAMLHEMGHTFGLPHSPDGFSVMSRGFDFFSRSLCVVEPPIGGHKDPVAFSRDQMTRWDPCFAAQLNFSPWFQPDGSNGSAFDTVLTPKVSFSGDDVVVDAPYGIRVVAAESESLPGWFTENRTGDAPKRLTLSRKDLRSKLHDTKDPFTIVVVDGHGLRAEIQDKL